MTDTGPTLPATPTTPTPNWFPETRNILAVFTVAGVFVLFFVSAFSKPLDPSVLGAAVPLAVMVLTWYFGSSKSSDDKNETIRDQLNKGP